MEPPPDPNTRRTWLARRIVAQERVRSRDKIIAAAIYGSVAHGAAAAHSDVELLFIVADDEPYAEQQRLVEGIQIEYIFLPESRILAEARRVTWKWGLQADQYRQQVVLFDPTGFFPRLRRASRELEAAAFTTALLEGWWLAFELRGKALNALEANDAPRAIYVGWEFAHSAALRIALHEQAPYESGRTLWGDVVQRGYGMAELVRALTTSDLAALGPTIDAVWNETSWEGP